MSAIILSLEANADDSRANEAGILPRAHAAHIIVAAGENDVVQGVAVMIELSEQVFAGWLDDVQLHGAFGLLMHYDDIATTQFGIDREVKERSVPETPVLVEPEPNSPNLLRFQGAFRARTRPSFQGRSSSNGESNDE